MPRVRGLLQVLMLACLTASVAAQEPAAAAPVKSAGSDPMFRSAGPIVPVKVQVVISRYRGEQKISSLPYTLAVNANDGRINPDGRYVPWNPARLRTGAEVPVQGLPAAANGPASMPVTYKTIGTNIDCSVSSADEGRFNVTLSIDDTSIYGEDAPASSALKQTSAPSFRTLRTTNMLMLKNGQTSQFTMAADKVTGDITRVDVTVIVER